MSPEMPAQEPDNQRPKWAQATTQDLLAVDIDQPVADLRSVDGYEYSTAYSKALKEAENTQDELSDARRNTFSMLMGVMGMHLKAEDVNQPFIAQLIFGDGRRSAIPADFTGTPVETLAEIAGRAKHTVVRTRFSDVCWLLDRKRSHLGRAALAGYVEILRRLDAGELTSLVGDQKSARTPEGQEIMHRALSLSRQLGWDTDEALDAKAFLNRLREDALNAKEPVPIHWFCELDLRFGVTDPAHIGATLETHINHSDPDDALELWRLASRAFHDANDQPASHRCLISASNCLVKQADAALAKQNSAMLASHFLSAAIAQLHGVRGMRQRLTELRHKLIDVQARVPDEMSPFSHPIDLRGIKEEVEKVGGRLGVKDLLFFFADLTKSPDPKALVEEARRSIDKHPLSSIFGSSHHDDEGKVVFRANDDASTIKVQIAQDENIRRLLHAKGQIDTVRRNMNSRIYVRKDLFRAFLQDSPFVPPDCLDTYSRGFSRFDPSAHRRADKLAERVTFQIVADEWLELQAKKLAAITLAKARWMLSKFIYPRLGSRPIREITATELLAALRVIESRGTHETAHRTKQRVGQIFRYGIATGRTERSPDRLRALRARRHPHVDQSSVQALAGNLQQ